MDARYFRYSDRQYRLLVTATDGRWREGLVASPIWEDFGFHFLPPCNDAREAMNSLDADPPDAVITEFARPPRSGFDFLRMLQAQLPEVLTVVFSAKQTPATLREAFVLGVFDFLPKSASHDLIASLAERIRRRLDERGGTTYFSGLHETVVGGLVRGTEDAHRRFPEACRMNWKPQAWKAAFLEIFPQPEDSCTLFLSVGRLLETAPVLGLKQRNLTRPTYELILLFYERSERHVNGVSADICGKLVRDLQQDGHEIACGLGLPVSALSGVPLSYQQARLALGQGMIRGAAIQTFVPEEPSRIQTKEVAEYVERFVRTLLSGGDWNALVDEYSRVVAASETPVRRIYQEIQTLFSTLADLIPPSPDLDAYYHIADFVRCPRDLGLHLGNLCRLVLRAVLERGGSLADRKVREFRDYVGKHYMDFNLNIGSVSSYLQISPSYLGKLLKKSLQTTFVTYLTEIRMAKAQELLTGSDLMTSRIAEMVGYVYTHYFSSTFKRRLGLTPSEFRSAFRSRALEAV